MIYENNGRRGSGLGRSKSVKCNRVKFGLSDEDKNGRKMLSDCKNSFTKQTMKYQIIEEAFFKSRIIQVRFLFESYNIYKQRDPTSL